MEELLIILEADDYRLQSEQDVFEQEIGSQDRETGDYTDELPFSMEAVPKKVLLPSFMQPLAWRKEASDLSIEEKREILVKVKTVGIWGRHMSDEDVEDVFKLYVENEVIVFGMPKFLNPVVFEKLLANYPSCYQPEEKHAGSMLAKEPLIPPEGEPEVKLASFRELVLHRIHLQHSDEELQDPDNPGHLPPLTARELRKLVLRCAQAEHKTYFHDHIPDEDKHENSRDYQLEKLLKSLELKKPIDQSDFDKGGKLEHWRYIPEYTADEKRVVLIKESLIIFRNYKSRVLTQEEIDHKTERFQKRSDNDIHYRYGDCHIHYMVEDFFGRLLETPHPWASQIPPEKGLRVMPELLEILFMRDI